MSGDPAFVLDTNVVIDWLVFDDAFMDPLRERVGRREVGVFTHSLAADELRRVLAYPALELDLIRREWIFEQYCRHTRPAPVPADFSAERLMLPARFPRCRDRDDELFLALAYHSSATLVSRDKAVLALRKRARKFGVSILDVAQAMELLRAR